MSDAELLYRARSWIEDSAVELTGQLIDVDCLTDGQVRRAVQNCYRGGWEGFAADGGAYEEQEDQGIASR